MFWKRCTNTPMPRPEIPKGGRPSDLPDPGHQWTPQAVQLSRVLWVVLLLHCPQTKDPAVQQTGLEYRAAPIGVEVRGVDLKAPVPGHVIAQIRQDVHHLRLLIFKDQSVVNASRQVEISRWFGRVVMTALDHPKSPHPDVFRVSNEQQQGHRNAGRPHWHVDGSVLDKQFTHSLYHMVAVASQGDTAFMPLTEFLEGVSPEKKARWSRLWISKPHWPRPKPVLYPHPVTGQPTAFVQNAVVSGLILDYGTETETPPDSSDEGAQILLEIQQEIGKDKNNLIYYHKWEVGDFIISDNLALAHRPTKETQLPVSEIGLRVLHRTTVYAHPDS